MDNLALTDNYPRFSLASPDNNDPSLPQSSAQSIDPLLPNTKVLKTVHTHFQDLELDVQKFVEIALSNRSINVVASPPLIRTAELMTARIMNMADLNGDAVVSGQDRPITRPCIKSTEEGMHVLSKRKEVDEILGLLQIPHTTSEDLEHKSPEQATAELNAQIAKDTRGMITNFINAKGLEDSDLAFLLVTWLFQQVSWRDPFKLMDEQASSEMTWENTARPKIQWMKSNNINVITHLKHQDYDFVAVPVIEKDMKAVFVLPPAGETNPNSEEFNQVLSNGLESILGKAEKKDAHLTLPKFKFDYEFPTNYPDAYASGMHKAALDIDEEGAKVATASCLIVSDFFMPPEKRHYFKFDRPFYVAFINLNTENPRAIAMARINKPWKDD